MFSRSMLSSSSSSSSASNVSFAVRISTSGASTFGVVFCNLGGVFDGDESRLASSLTIVLIAAASSK